MIKAMICCGGGFSSSSMAAFIENGIKEHHLEEEVSIEFCPFQLSATKFPDYDIIVCCPHLNHQIKDHNKRYIKNQIPMYILPMQMYGPVDIRDLLQDMKDVIAGFEKNPQNPFFFPGEEKIMRVKRKKSYRSMHPDYQP